MHFSLFEYKFVYLSLEYHAIAVADPGFDLRGGVDFVNGGVGVEKH